MQNTNTPLPLVLASVLVLALGAVATAHAQNMEDAPSNAEREQSGGAGFFAIGVNATDLGSLNNRLADAGYPTFASEMLSLGGGGYGVVAGHLLLGGEGHGLITSDGSYQGRTVSVGGGYGLFTLGYLFRPTSNLRAYPQLGIGGGGLVLEIGSTGEDDFNDVLEDPNRSATLNKGSLLVNLGAGLEYQFSTPKESGGFRIGVRAGYLLSPYESNWALDENTLSGGPDASIGGPFIRLIIGGGGSAIDSE